MSEKKDWEKPKLEVLNLGLMKETEKKNSDKKGGRHEKAMGHQHRDPNSFSYLQRCRCNG
jgi:hypothetical protein